jgi:hypothetical protein
MNVVGVNAGVLLKKECQLQASSCLAGETSPDGSGAVPELVGRTPWLLCGTSTDSSVSVLMAMIMLVGSSPMCRWPLMGMTTVVRVLFVMEGIAFLLMSLSSA